jgi:dipeptidyl aminopeptidase/acylaminoacyl peptidase
MAFVHQRRWLVVTILGSLLVGCTPPDDTPSAEPTPEAHEQVSPGLIAFVSDREGSDALFVMQPDGLGVRRLTGELPPVSHPSWSADGQRIAFNAGSPTASDIYLINIDGSGLTKITSDARANFYPTWSPDGSRLAFSSNRDGDWDIYVMNADGSRVRQLVDSPGLDDNHSGRRTVRGSDSPRPVADPLSFWLSTRRPVNRARSFRNRSTASIRPGRRMGHGSRSML